MEIIKKMIVYREVIQRGREEKKTKKKKVKRKEISGSCEDKGVMERLF